MREIKFRAWDKERKQMRYQDKEFFHIGLRHGKIGNEFWKELSMSVDNFYTPEQGEIQQYTGLKDKNGKEIYEGDLIKDSDSGSIGAVIFDESTLCFTTKFQDNDLWGFVPQKGKDNHCEVIGNIYEHTEFKLEGAKR